MSDGNGNQARRRQFIIEFLTYRCVEVTRRELFRKRETIFYPAFNFYPGGSTYQWWEANEGLFYFCSRFRRQQFLTLLDEMKLIGKMLKCSSGTADRGTAALVHNHPADLCIMVILNHLSYPGTFKAIQDTGRCFRDSKQQVIRYLSYRCRSHLLQV